MPRAFRTRAGETFYLHAVRSGEEDAPDGTTYFFSRDISPDEVVHRLPAGLRVFEHPRSGLPLLARERVNPDGRVTWERVAAAVEPATGLEIAGRTTGRVQHARRSRGDGGAPAADPSTEASAEPDVPLSSDRIFLPWVFAGVVGGFVVDLAVRPIGEGVPGAAVPILSAGALMASLPIEWLGQWLVLRPYVSRASGWILASVAGVVLSSPVTLGVLLVAAAHLPRFATDILLQTTAGIGLGLLQWAFLRTRFRNAVLWIPVSAVAFVVRGFAPISRAPIGAAALRGCGRYVRSHYRRGAGLAAPTREPAPRGARGERAAMTGLQGVRRCSGQVTLSRRRGRGG
jgi:hypothetical protein